MSVGDEYWPRGKILNHGRSKVSAACSFCSGLFHLSEPPHLQGAWPCTLSDWADECLPRPDFGNVLPQSVSSTSHLMSNTPGSSKHTIIHMWRAPCLPETSHLPLSVPPKSYWRQQSVRQGSSESSILGAGNAVDVWHPGEPGHQSH